jgi:hypothetical protein
MQWNSEYELIGTDSRDGVPESQRARRLINEIYSGKRLKASTLFGEDLSDVTHSRVLTFTLTLIDSCVPYNSLFSSHESIAAKKNNEN